MRLTGRVDPVPELTEHDLDEMFHLMGSFFDNLHRERFDADLDDKDWVLRILDSARNALCGFSEQKLVEMTIDGRRIRALYSGDTVISRRCSIDRTLLKMTSRIMASLVRRHEEEELYWFLPSESVRTYRLLPAFFREFHPRRDVPTPPEVRTIIDRIGSLRFPDRFDAETGVLRAEPGFERRLRAELARVPDRLARDPDVRFFVGANPGFMQADNLCCLARLSMRNFTRSARRLLAQRSTCFRIEGIETALEKRNSR